MKKLKILKIFKIPEQIPVWRLGKLTLGVRDQFLSYRAVVELIRKEIDHTFQIQIVRNFSARGYDFPLPFGV